MRARAVVGIVVAALVLSFVLGTASCSDDEPDGPELVADFTYVVDTEDTQTTSCPVASIAFTDTSTGAPDAWLWTFSDGSSSVSPAPIVDHAVEEATLTVTRGDDTATVTKPVSYPVC